MTKPSFNEYATQYYHQLIAAADGNANRAEAVAEAVEQATLALTARPPLCYPPEASLAARAAIDDYDDTQGRAGDRILAVLASGTVDQPTGIGSAEIKRTIVKLGNGRRKLFGDLTADDLSYMRENRAINHARAGSALAITSENIDLITPAIVAHGTITAAIDAGEFRSSSVNERDNERAFNIPGTDRSTR